MPNKYMHLVNGKPAVFLPQYNWIGGVSRRIKTSDLANSLRQIRREQKLATEEDDREREANIIVDRTYSYIIINVD